MAACNRQSGGRKPLFQNKDTAQEYLARLFLYRSINLRVFFGVRRIAKRKDYEFMLDNLVRFVKLGRDAVL